LIDKRFSGAEYMGRIAPMIEQDKKSWNKGRADAMRGAASKCPPGLDKLAYSSGYIEGEAQREASPACHHVPEGHDAAKIAARCNLTFKRVSWNPKKGVLR
jgi:hypothetical protein